MRNRCHESDQVIAGWDEGILTMRVGGKRHLPRVPVEHSSDPPCEVRELKIPPKLGYGSRGIGRSSSWMHVETRRACGAFVQAQSQATPRSSSSASSSESAPSPDLKTDTGQFRGREGQRGISRNDVMRPGSCSPAHESQCTKHDPVL